MLKSIIKKLSSPRLTIWLIIFLTLIFAFGLWIPQKRLLRELYFDWQRSSPVLVSILDALQLTEIYTSPITLTIWLLFFVNLALVIWQRIPLVRDRVALSDAKLADPTAAPSYPFKQTFRLSPETDFHGVAAALGSNGYAIYGDANKFYGVKNRYSPLAFLFFHLSFFLILLGGVVSMYTKFIAYVDLAQGEVFQGELERYNQPAPIPPKIGSIPRVSFMVQGIAPRVVGNTPTGISVMLVDASDKAHEVGINTPYEADNTSFVFKHLGMAPLFVITDAAGKEIDGAVFKLDVLQGRKDTFKLAGYDFTARFYPDYIRYNDRDATKTMEFNNPVFKIEVDRAGQKIAEALVPQKGSMAFNGVRLEMRDLSYWVRFYVIKEYGIVILYTGFAIATIAIIWRLLFFRREIVGAVRKDADGSVLVVAGRAEYYKSLAEDEFAVLFEKLLTKI